MRPLDGCSGHMDTEGLIQVQVPRAHGAVLEQAKGPGSSVRAGGLSASFCLVSFQAWHMDVQHALNE